MIEIKHPTAIIDPGAQIGNDVCIGPYCVIGKEVTLGNNVRLHSHVVIEGRTTIGEKTEIFPFASIGHIPQDMKYGGEPSELIIGKNNRIREYVTMQPGTIGDKMKTIVGDNGLFMAGAHVAHDCVISNNVQMANNAILGGHVEIGDFAIVGGNSAVHQFVRIGHHAIVGGMSGVEHDVIPYGSVKGERAFLNGLNIIGMKRRGVPRDDIDALRKAYKQLFDLQKTRTLLDRTTSIEEDYRQIPSIMDIVSFIRIESSRGLCLPDPIS
jgi:UDP-N-acetylglucosamine acyltransferase